MHNRYNRLRAWLDKLLDSEFRDLVRSFLKPAEQSHLPAPVELVNRGDFLGTMQRLDRLDGLEEHLSKHYADRKPSSGDVAPVAQPAHPRPSALPQRIPFTNREDEINLVLSSYAPAYYLLDAPAGYGKTELLRELERRFKEKGWVCAYVSLGKDETLPQLVANLAQELGLGSELALTTQDPVRLGLNLAGELRRHRLEDITDQGLAFLIDLEKEPPLETIQELLGKFIPNVQDSLRTMEFFATQHNRFRAILTGRYLARRTEIRDALLPLETRRLSPFSFKVVRDAAREYLVGYDEDSVIQISTHIMHLTGGHPGCVAGVLKMYREKNLPPDRFIEYFGRQTWDEISCGFVEEVRDGIPEETRWLLEVLDRLSIFRYLDCGVLRRLMRDGLLPNIDSEHDLADKLTGTYLFDWKIRLLRDDVMRRLLVIRLWWELSEKEFHGRCQKAQSICADHLQDATTQMPEMWAIEYLFQAIQQHARLVHKEEQRKNIRQTFFEEEVPKALQMLVKNRDRRVELNALKQAMEEDWEFRFTVNYCLREDQYSNEPYRDLLQRISQFSTLS